MTGGNGEMEKKRDCNDSWKQKKRRYMKEYENLNTEDCLI